MSKKQITIDLILIFGNAAKALTIYGWGSDEHINTENVAFEFARLNGWNIEGDDEWQRMSLSMDSPELLGFGLIRALDRCVGMRYNYETL